MSQILISNLSFAYDNCPEMVFENVTFNLDTDWKLGFTGRNGRGKTTFLKLLLGKYEYKGLILKKVEMLYFPYVVPCNTKLTITILEEIAPAVENWEILREISYLDLSEDILHRPYNTLSLGEQTKVLLGILFLKENSFLLIDEPTNHLDLLGRQVLTKYLKRKKGFILVSHDRKLLDETTDHTLSINKTNIEIQKGNFSSWFANKERQDNFEVAQNEKHKREIKRLERAAKTTKKWSDLTEASKFGGEPCDRGYIGHKAAKMMKRSKSIERRVHKNIAEKKNLLKNIEQAEELDIIPNDTARNKIIEVVDLAACYDGISVVNNVNFTVKKGEKIGLKGSNGSGKSTILKLLIGEDICYRGIIEKNNDIIISYVSQDTDMLKGTLNDYAKAYKIDETLFKSILIKLDFTSSQFQSEMQYYSAGQKKKVLIAKSLSQKADIYIWDEPLNHIDVLSRVQIEELVKGSNMTLLFVEHDEMFCDNIADRMVTLDK